jgi:hypothetical protein
MERFPTNRVASMTAAAVSLKPEISKDRPISTAGEQAFLMTSQNLLTRRPDRPQRGKFFASPSLPAGLNFHSDLEQEARTMSLARPFHVAMVFAAFLFVGAIVVGAL